MKKKLIAMLLTGAMALSLAACGGGGDTPNNGGGSNGGGSNGGTEGGSAPVADNGETYNIKMQIVTFGQEFTGLADVENAINAITEPEIGATVTLEPIAAWDLPTTSSLAVTSNEKLDLMCILPMASGMDSISNYSTKNMLIELNELYAAYGQDIAASIGDLEKVGYVGGSLYAIPANYYAGSGGSFVAVTSELEALGMEFDESKMYTLEDIEGLLKAYKDAKGDGYYSIAGFADGGLIGTIMPTDDLGDPAIGCLLDGGLSDTTVVNKYATDEYYENAKKVRGYFEAGYINPDVISITDTWVALLQSGQYLGAFVGTNGVGGMDGILVNEQTVGQDLTVIRFIDDFATTSKASYGMWAIPVTCENPEKTMQFLNLLYQDRELSQNVGAMLSTGLEGKTYKVVETLDDGRAIIDYADGVDRMSAPYSGQVPIYGNELKNPKFVPIDAEMFDQISNYNSTIQYSKAFGYTFDASAYGSQIAAINNVITQYRALLDWGAVDVDSTLPTFISELEAAGINDVIAANQEQLDAWLAQQ